VPAKLEQDTWLPGCEPQADWDLIPIDSIWERADGWAFKVLSVDREKLIISIIRVERTPCGYVAACGALRHDFLAFPLLKKFPNFTRVSNGG
jgi:hypothetical protein